MPLEELRAEHKAWMLALSRAAEAWVNAHTAGQPTDHYERKMREAEQNTRRLERRMRRRKANA